MTNRRTFIKGSVAASMFVLSPGVQAALESLNDPAFPLYKVLFDARHDVSVRFAAAFAEQGTPTHGLPNGNITALWRDDLAARWARKSLPLAGCTDANVLFCLEQLGRQYGLHVLHREEEYGGLVTWVVAPRRV